MINESHMGWPPPRHEPVLRRRKLAEAEHRLSSAAAALSSDAFSADRARAIRALRRHAQRVFAARLALIKARRSIAVRGALATSHATAAEREIKLLSRQERRLRELGVDGILLEFLAHRSLPQTRRGNQ